MPARTPTLTPRSASGPAIAATIAAGPGVVDAPGEDQADLAGRDAAVDGVGDHGRGLLPEHEARPRPDVAAALAPLQHEPPAPVAEVLLEQSGRGDVQEGRGCPVAPAPRPGRAGRRRSGPRAAGPRRRPRAARRGARAGRSRGRRRPRAGPPSRSAVSSQERPDLGPAEHRQRQERQARRRAPRPRRTGRRR